jgi:hypothetical protein
LLDILKLRTKTFFLTTTIQVTLRRQGTSQEKDIAMEKPDLVLSLSASYDQWRTEVQPSLSNEDAQKSGPKINPFRKDYLDQMTKAE